MRIEQARFEGDKESFYKSASYVTFFYFPPVQTYKDEPSAHDRCELEARRSVHPGRLLVGALPLKDRLKLRGKKSEKKQTSDGTHQQASHIQTKWNQLSTRQVARLSDRSDGQTGRLWGFLSDKKTQNIFMLSLIPI